MNRLLSSFILLISSFMLLVNCAPKSTTKQATSSNGYAYEYVENDPLNTRIYTLKNGLKVYLSAFDEEPRIQTYVAVRAGSKNDPAETTGLAHYLEHMLFKGNSEIASLNWEKEKVLLQQISDLYEAHKATNDEGEKAAIYQKIDSLSYEASKYVVPNEYDKMVSSLGAKRTNAYTSTDRTVYMNDISATELDKWIHLESSRFKELTLRLFHTELETVYEEFNRTQDNDGRQAFMGILELLYQNHPYGTQSTIGKGEHLKNPSMVNIHNFFDTYYRPNNIAICLSGDLDYDETIAKIDANFGDWEKGPIPEFTYQAEAPRTEPVSKTVVGPQPANVMLGFSFDGAGSDDRMKVTLIDMLLANSKAGLIDLNLVKGQKVLSAFSFVFDPTDYTIHFVGGNPREGQTLEEVQALILEEIENIKKGNFDDWMLEAVIKDLKLNAMRAAESNGNRAHRMVDAFIDELPWSYFVEYNESLSKITKADIVAFANEHYGSNYAVVYKEQGENDNRHKVEKPDITPVVINRDTQSDFYKDFAAMESARLKPQFLNYDADIKKDALSNQVPFHYIHNNLNEIFTLEYIIDMGTDHNQWLSVATQYLPLLGTDQYEFDALQKEFYKLGVSFDVRTGRERTRIILSGLQESLNDGVELMEHVLASVEPNQEKYDGLVQDIAKRRADAKQDKGRILFGGLRNYAAYGSVSPFSDKMEIETIKNQDVNEVCNIIKGLTQYPHTVLYYGPAAITEAKSAVQAKHQLPAEYATIPEAKQYKQLATDNNKVYFVHYDMKQAEMMMINRSLPSFDESIMAPASVFNEYFGAGLSSIVFQEIREKKSLAYAAYSWFTSPSVKDEGHYLIAYIGTQSDKLEDAVSAMGELMNNMPRAQLQYEAAIESAQKKIESERITRLGIYRNYQAAQDRGLNKDMRKDIYAALDQMTIDQLEAFFNANIKGSNYHYAVIGDKDEVDFNALSKLGKVEKLDLEEVFGY